MRFTPKSEQEVLKDASKFQPFPPGQYDFEVMEAKDEVSSKGNDMLHLTIKLFHPTEDWTRWVHDYITESMSHKLRHFAYAVGLGIKYESGTLDAGDCVGRCGKVAVRIKKDAGYDAKNEIQDYVVPANYQETKEVVQTAVMSQGAGVQADPNKGEIDEDSIPF